MTEEDIRMRQDRRAFAILCAIGFAVFLALLAFTPQIGPLFRINTIPSTAMAPNFPQGHFAVANLSAYGYSRYSFEWFQLPIGGRIMAADPARGDAVIFRVPANGRVTTYISRTIGLPGDRIQMAGGRLHINGEAVQREALSPYQLRADGRVRSVQRWRETLPGGASHEIIETDGDTGLLDNTAVFEVPAGHIFVLGDNRDNSSDSRVSRDKGGIGFVPLAQLAGKVVGTFDLDDD